MSHSHDDFIETLDDEAFEYLCALASGPFVMLIALALAIWSSWVWAILALVLGPTITFYAAKTLRGAIT